MQHRIVDGANLQLDAASVAEFLRQRNIFPAEARGTHIDGDEAIAGAGAAQQAAIGVDGHGRPAGLAKQKVGNTAGGVAAAFHLIARIVPDAHADVG